MKSDYKIHTNASSRYSHTKRRVYLISARLSCTCSNNNRVCNTQQPSAAVLHYNTLVGMPYRPVLQCITYIIGARNIVSTCTCYTYSMLIVLYMLSCHHNTVLLLRVLFFLSTKTDVITMSKLILNVEFILIFERTEMSEMFAKN